jgi:hypothetical protein
MQKVQEQTMNTSKTKKIIRCVNCGEELMTKTYNWKGYQAEYCSMKCAVECCPCGELEVHNKLQEKQLGGTK